MGSDKFSFSKEDIIKVFKGALIAGLAAVVTYLAQYFGFTTDPVEPVMQAASEQPAEGIPPVVLMWLLSIGLNAARKWFFKQGK